MFVKLAVWNADFKEVFPDLNAKELNHIEMELLRWLDYKVSLTGRQVRSSCNTHTQER